MTREQVIKGLECCASLDSGGCAVCDWADPEEYECFANLAKAALTLLKEQEARVRTLGEVLGGDECWVEYINGGCGYCDCYLDDDAKSIVINRTLRKDFNVSPNGYGKVWRCWSARPTDEQRKAVKWE